MRCPQLDLVEGGAMSATSSDFDLETRPQVWFRAGAFDSLRIAAHFARMARQEPRLTRSVCLHHAVCALHNARRLDAAARRGGFRLPGGA